MTSYFCNIGFPVETEDKINELADQVVRNGQRYERGAWSLTRWRCDKRIGLSLLQNAEYRSRNLIPEHFGNGRLNLRVASAFVKAGPGYHRRDLIGVCESTEDPPFDVMIEVPDIVITPDRFAEGNKIKLNITPFISAMVCDADEQAFAARCPQLSLAGGRLVYASGLFEDNGVHRASPSPQAKVLGRICSVDRPANPVTGLSYLVLGIQTQGGTLEAVVDPNANPDNPVIGGIVTAGAWLRGSLSPDC